MYQFGSTFWTNLAYLTLCITITTVAAMALLMFDCVLHMFFMWNDSTDITLLIFIGKLKPTIGMITYRNTCALDSKGKIAYKLI